MSPTMRPTRTILLLLCVLFALGEARDLLAPKTNVKASKVTTKAATKVTKSAPVVKCNGAKKAVCAGVCANLNSDANNCGACGIACSAGAKCAAGRCMCGAVACANGQTCLNNKCVSVAPSNVVPLKPRPTQSPRPSPSPKPSPSPSPKPSPPPPSPSPSPKPSPPPPSPTPSPPPPSPSPSPKPSPPPPSPTPSPPPSDAGIYLLPIPGRIQYDDNNGYCGEVSIQTLMLRYGAWIPQEVARAAGGSELLPGRNYDQALNALRVSYDRWGGSGGYQGFFAFAKQKLKAGLGVITVAFYQGGKDNFYDHIEPVVGVRTATSSDAYDPADTFYVHANYATAAIQRVASGFWCTAAAKTSGLMQGGCVPAATTHGYAVRGPAYSGIGPAVELAVSSAREPGLGLSVAMSGTITIKNLVPGQAYELHMVTSLAAVPASANPAALSGTPLSSFVADGATRTFSATFQSGTPAYFICVAA